MLNIGYTQQWLLPAGWYLLPIVSYASSTEILRLALRMTRRAGRGTLSGIYIHRPLKGGKGTGFVGEQSDLRIQ